MMIPLSEKSLDDFVHTLIFERGLSQNTASAYRNDIKRYLEFLKSRRIEQPSHIKPDHVRELISSLSQYGMSSSSAARNISAIRMFHRYLMSIGQMSDDPASELTPPRGTKKLPTVLDIGEIESILKQPDISRPAGLRDRAILECLYATGIRVSELITLKKSDMNCEEGYVRVIGKGSKERVVPVGDIAVSYIGRYVSEVRVRLAEKNRGGDTLFLNMQGSPISRISIWKILKVCAERAGIQKNISPHTMRPVSYTHLTLPTN